MGILCLLCVCLFVCFSFVCTVTDFSATERRNGVKLCMPVRLLSGMSFFHFGELWLAWSHGGGITSGMYTSSHWCQAAAPGEAWWAIVIGCRGSVGDLQLQVAASCKAVWWDLRLASLLMHLLRPPYVIGHANIFLPRGFFYLLFSSPNLSRRRLDVCHTSTHGVALVRI